MDKAGVPGIIRALQASWSQQVRGCTFAGYVAEQPIRDSPALLQGGPWSPYCLALLLAPVIRCIHATHPQMLQVTYMDDRSALCSSIQDLHFWLATWRRFEALGRLRTQPTKSQFWGRTPQHDEDLAAQGLQPQQTITIWGLRPVSC